ncbi:MAG: substrate-binding domain-containing protein [Vagococcus sp.]|jgi:DNA-binding LacI/PurR family transcriptional regulator|nr:substrate-binding domain-containing protein [Vagococcus sp.]
MVSKPLYKQILDDLVEDIINGTYKENDQLPTELELSEKYNVSRITSKRALTELEAIGLISRTRGKGSFVKKREVDKVVKEPSKNILLIFPFLSEENTGLGEYTQGILEELQSKDYQLLVQTENFLIDTPINEIVSNYVGVIYYPQKNLVNLEVLYQLYLNDIPIVLLDKFFHGVPFSSVTANNLIGGKLATNHLIEEGHEKIAFASLTGEIDISSVRDRYLGYLNALHEADILDSFHLTQQLDQTKEAYLDYIVTQINEHQITAIVLENDVLAVQLINHLHQVEIDIPEKVAIVGFDNIQASSLIQPGLTTIEQNFVEIGRVACQMVLDQLETGSKTEIHQKTEVKLIIRDSSSLKERK